MDMLTKDETENLESLALLLEEKGHTTTEQDFIDLFEGELEAIRAPKWPHGNLCWPTEEQVNQFVADRKTDEN